jgi:hypothetical protein
MEQGRMGKEEINRRRIRRNEETKQNSQDCCCGFVG